MEGLANKDLGAIAEIAKGAKEELAVRTNKLTDFDLWTTKAKIVLISPQEYIEKFNEALKHFELKISPIGTAKPVPQQSKNESSEKSRCCTIF
jgi:hypothetical protein